MRDLWHLCRSPPTNQCANQCANFDELKAHYLQARLGTVTSKEQVSGNKVKASNKARKCSPKPAEVLDVHEDADARVGASWGCKA